MMKQGLTILIHPQLIKDNLGGEAPLPILLCTHAVSHPRRRALKFETGLIVHPIRRQIEYLDFLSVCAMQLGDVSSGMCVFAHCEGCAIAAKNSPTDPLFPIGLTTTVA